MKKQIVLGPPGTGKTTYLLNVVDECLKAGIRPDRIAYVAYTKKAAREARQRAVDRFQYQADDFPWFCTLHSMAARVMGMKKDDYLYKSNYEEIGKNTGLLGLTGSDVDYTTERSEKNEGNHLLRVIDVARNKKLSLQDHLRTMPERELYYTIGESGHTIKQLAIELIDYKRTFGLKDYTDLIIDPVRLEYPPLDIDVAIVDEGQDLTAIQWDFVNRMLSRAQRLYIAGDDDQAIYSWNGADVQQFLHLDGERHVLNKSYRLPRRPWMLSNWISGKISERYEKNWTHNGNEGEVFTVVDPRTAHILEGGEWLVLARNSAYLGDIHTWLVNKGVPFRRHKGAPVINPDHMAAIHGWVDVTAGKQISGAKAKAMYEQLRTKKHIGYGGKVRLMDVEDDAMLAFDELRDEFALLADPTAQWWDVLEKIKSKKIDYYRRVRALGESLSKPRVLLSTIHGAKGGECDNVLLLPDMTRQTYSMFTEGRKFPNLQNEEHRVFYVGASRARKRLIISTPLARDYYKFPKLCEKAKAT